MSTDQTSPPPASATLPGSVASAGAAEDVHPIEVRAPGLDEVPVSELDELQASDLDEFQAADRDRIPTTAGSAPHPVGSSWQAEASGELVAMSFPGARRIAGWLFWVVFPLLCIGAIHASVTNVVHHLGNKPVGIRGTFVVQPRSCSQGFCSFGGLFTSDDGTIKNLPLLGDPRWRTAEVHKVTYDPRSVEVAALPGQWDPTPSVMAAFGALTYLGFIGYFLRQRRRSNQQRRPARVARDPVPTG